MMIANSQLLLAIVSICITSTLASSSSSSNTSGRRRGSQRTIESKYSEQVSDEWNQIEPSFSATQADYDGPVASAGARIGTAFIYSDENDLLQDPTAFGLFDSSILDQATDLTRLYGQDLINYYNSIVEASRPLFHHMTLLRLDTIEEGKLVGPLIASIIEQKGEVDFTRYAHTDSTFAEYGTPLLALGSQNKLLRRMDDTVNKLRHKFSMGDHNVGLEGSRAALIGIKKDAIRFEKIVEEIRSWTNPGSLSQVHQLIKLYGYDKAQKYIHKEEAESKQIAELFPQ